MALGGCVPNPVEKLIAHSVCEVMEVLFFYPASSCFSSSSRKPLILRSLICPLASSPNSSRSAAVSLGCAPCVFTRRRNSNCSRSIARSEEHTSELQSLAYLVCRLLLEKKKKTNTHSVTTHRPRHCAY